MLCGGKTQLVSSGRCKDGENTVYPQLSKLLQFDYNEASSCMVGMTWDGAPYGPLARNKNNAADRSIWVSHFQPPVTPIFRGNVMYKNSRRPFYMRGQLTVFEKSVIADNSDGALWAYETIFRNSATIGWSRNAEVDFFYDEEVRQVTKGNTMRPKGIMVYDGPLVSSNMVFAGFPTSRVGRNMQWVPGYEWSQPGIDAVGQHLSVVVGDPLTQEQFNRMQSFLALSISDLTNKLNFIRPSTGTVVKPVAPGFRAPSGNDVTPAGIGINPAEFRFFAQVQRAEFMNPPVSTFFPFSAVLYELYIMLNLSPAYIVRPHAVA